MFNITNLLSSTLFLVITSSVFGQNYMSTVGMLHDRIERQRFLISVFQFDQEIREYEDSVMVASGWRTEEHLTAIDSLHLVDSLLVTQIDKYLDLYGFPDKDDYSEIPRITPWIILHHSKNRDIRRKQLPKLYSAYKDENLEERRFLAILEDEYELEFQKHFQSYNVEEARVGELMEELDIMPARGRRLLRSQ